MRVKFKRGKRSAQRGQSLIEFAISLVMLMILLAAVVDGGRALFTYMMLRDAAQEGALYGSLEPTDTAGINARVAISSDMANAMVDNGELNIQVAYTDTSGNPKTTDICLGDGITVTTSVPQFVLTMPFIGAFIGRQWVPISASITDTVLRPPCP